jgi:hypothetical protein
MGEFIKHTNYIGWKKLITDGIINNGWKNV